MSYEAMTLNAFYIDPMAEGVSFRLQVLAADGSELRSVLYQLGGDGLPNFSHGFTGLHYVYEAGAMLQYWCTVPEP